MRIGRWIFWINVPIGIAALVLAYRVLPSNNTSEKEKTIPILANVLSIQIDFEKPSVCDLCWNSQTNRAGGKGFYYRSPSGILRLNGAYDYRSVAVCVAASLKGF